MVNHGKRTMINYSIIKYFFLDCAISMIHHNKTWLTMIEQEAQLKQGLADRTAKTAVSVAI